MQCVWYFWLFCLWVCVGAHSKNYFIPQHVQKDRSFGQTEVTPYQSQTHSNLETPLKNLLPFNPNVFQKQPQLRHIELVT